MVEAAAGNCSWIDYLMTVIAGEIRTCSEAELRHGITTHSHASELKAITDRCGPPKVLSSTARSTDSRLLFHLSVGLSNCTVGKSRSC